MDRSLNIKLSLKIFACLCMVFVVAACNRVEEKPIEETQPQFLTPVSISSEFEIGKPLPVIESYQLNGNFWSSSQLSTNAPTILTIWESSCSGCVSDIFFWQGLIAEYDQKINIVGIHRTSVESVETAIQFLVEKNLDFINIQDDGQIYQASGGIGMPITILVDKENIITDIYKGPMTSEYLNQQIKTLME